MITQIILCCRNWCGCAKTIEEVDQCALDSMFFGNNHAIIPSNEAEMDQHCSTIKGGVACMRDFANTCLTGFPQQTMGMVLASMAKHMDNRCGKPEERKEFMDHVKCFNPREKMNPLNVCSDKNIVMMEKIKDMADDQKSSAVCCSFHLFHECTVSQSKKVCGDGNSQYWDEMIQEVADESVSLACADFDSVAKCEKSMKPDLWSQLKTISDSNDPNVYKHNYKTQIPIMLEMIKKYHV